MCVLGGSGHLHNNTVRAKKATACCRCRRRRSSGARPPFCGSPHRVVKRVAQRARHGAVGRVRERAVGRGGDGAKARRRRDGQRVGEQGAAAAGDGGRGGVVAQNAGRRDRVRGRARGDDVEVLRRRRRGGRRADDADRDLVFLVGLFCLRVGVCFV